MTPSTSLLLGLELRLLRYVIAVAEELHFTRASQRLHLATPSLSKQIRQLEEALGYSLFERRTREVALTSAGAAFVVEARRALMYAQRAVEAGAAANASNVGVCRIGYTPLLDTTLLPQIREAFVQTMGSASLLFQSTYSMVQIDQILKGQLQAGLVVLPIASNELRVDTVFRYRLIAAIPEASDLAERSVLRPADIAGKPIIWFGRPTNSHLYQHFVDWCREAGFIPNIAHEVSTVIEMLDAVSAGVGVGFVKESIRTRLHPEGIAFRELAAPVLSIEIGMAHRDESRSESVSALLRVLNQLSAADHGDGRSAVRLGPG